VNYDTMTDRELDALCEERVMGLLDVEYCRDLDVASLTKGIGGQVPYYASDISAAWTVIEKMRGEGWFYTIADNAPLRSGRGSRKGEVFARFFIRRTCKSSCCHKNPARAIVIAALKAKEHP
jgi:hypothetical protein